MQDFGTEEGMGGVYSEVGLYSEITVHVHKMKTTHISKSAKSVREGRTLGLSVDRWADCLNLSD